MNDLEKFFWANKDNRIFKWKHYFEIYDRHFSKFRGEEINVVEIGVQHGGSARMWRDYFGPKATIYGIDKDPRCAGIAEKGIEIIIGDQSNRDFLDQVRRFVPQMDILIDDGGHTMEQQIITFEELYPHIRPKGVYLCEDLHTSYWNKWGGGFERDGTFIEFSKRMIDWLHAWHSDEIEVSDFTKTTDSLHFYDSVLVVEKHPRDKPSTVETGRKMFKAG